MREEREKGRFVRNATAPVTAPSPTDGLGGKRKECKKQRRTQQCVYSDRDRRREREKKKKERERWALFLAKAQCSCSNGSSSLGRKAPVARLLPAVGRYDERRSVAEEKRRARREEGRDGEERRRKREDSIKFSFQHTHTHTHTNVYTHAHTHVYISLLRNHSHFFSPCPSFDWNKPPLVPVLCFSSQLSSPCRSFPLLQQSLTLRTPSATSGASIAASHSRRRSMVSSAEAEGSTP